MVSEGDGRVSPSPELQPLTEDDWKMIDRLGRLRAKKYQGRSGYAGGLMGNATTPHIIGVAGELALAFWMNAKLGQQVFNIDQTDQADGGSDFSVCGLKVDAKQCGSGRELLVTRVRDSRLIRITADIFVAVQVSLEYPDVVRLLGWIKRTKLEQFNKSPIRTATHFNLVATMEDLEPMSRLVRYFKAKMRERGVA